MRLGKQRQQPPLLKKHGASTPATLSCKQATLQQPLHRMQCPHLKVVAIFWPLAFWLAFPTHCQGQESPSAGHSIRFQDRTQDSGIDFEHDDGSGKQYLFELMPAGMATLDFDRDGTLDCYLLNGGSPTKKNEPKSRNGLYRGLGQLRWTDVSRTSGTDDSGFGLGVTAADYDQDGFTDIYISNFGGNCLLHNNGDGTFSDITSETAVGDGQRFGAGVAFLDVDGDHDLDLYCAAYVDFQFERHAEIAPRSYPFPPGPKDFAAIPDTLFLNNGNGTFSDWSAESGIASVAGPSMGIICGDFDDDGDTDVFVCCDGAPDHLFRNQGDGRFEEDGVLSGVAYNQAGIANGSMGVDAADLNDDGIGDLFVTDYSGQVPMLFLSSPGGFYSDQATRSKAGKSVLPHVNWGAAWGDFELDGDFDLLILNGHFLTDPEATGSRTSFDVPNTLLEQVAPLRFSDTTAFSGDGLVASASSRACVVEDFDLDGDLDALILNCGAKAQLLENTSALKGKSLALELIGTASNRDAVGAKVKVTAGNRSWHAEVRSGRGYQSHFGSRLHFGLGTATPKEVEIRWPSGRQQRVPLNAQSPQFLRVIEAEE